MIVAMWSGKCIQAICEACPTEAELSSSSDTNPEKLFYEVSFTFRIMESYGGDIREVNIKQTKKSFLVVPEVLAIASLAILK